MSVEYTLPTDLVAELRRVLVSSRNGFGGMDSVFVFMVRTSSLLTNVAMDLVSSNLDIVPSQSTASTGVRQTDESCFAAREETTRKKIK